MGDDLYTYNPLEFDELPQPVLIPTISARGVKFQLSGSESPCLDETKEEESEYDPYQQNHPYEADEGEEEEEEEEEENGEEEEESMSNLSFSDMASNCSGISVAHKSGWSKFGVKGNPWDEQFHQVVKILEYDELVLNEDEENGILSDRVIYACSTVLDKNPESHNFTLSKLELIEKGLNDVRILEAHRYLQYIDLSWNALTDVSALSGVPYLMYLDVSHNDLTSVLQFKPPWNLTYVNYSYNKVKQISDLTDFWSITNLDLSNNQIKHIEGLQNLRYLNNLNLSSNAIKHFENLNCPHLEFLNISNNQISTFEEGPDVGMKTMLNLSYLDISYNYLSTLAIFEGVYFLKSCHMCENVVEDLLDISFMKSMHMLRDLDLTDNPLTQWPKYRQVVIHTIPSLTYLDNYTVQTQEKISTKYMFDPDAQVTAACDHARLLLIEGLNEPSLGLDTVPFDQGPFPLVVLVGPPASMKVELMNDMIKKLGSERIHRGVHHISRAKKPHEVDGYDYHFVTQDKFNELTRNGAFLSVTEIMGIGYGFSRTELATAVKENKLCITSMDLKGALTLKSCGVSPRLVLVMTESEQLHAKRLRIKHIGSTKSLYWLPTPNVESLLTDEETGIETSASEMSNVSLLKKSSLSTSKVSNVSLSKKSSHSTSKMSNVSQLKESSHSVGRISSCQNEAVDLNESCEMYDLKWIVKKGSLSVSFEFEQDAVSEKASSGAAFSERTISGGTLLSVGNSSAAQYEDTLSLDVVSDLTSIVVGKKDTSLSSAVTLGSYPSSSKTKSSAKLSRSDSIASKQSSVLNANVEDAPAVFEPLKVSKSTVETLYTTTSIKSRDAYLNTHLENPGLFSETIYTDNMDIALKQLCCFVKGSFESYPKQYPLFNPDEDKAYQTMIPRRLDQFLEEIYTEHSITEKQIDQAKRYVSPKVLPPRSPANIAGKNLSKSQKCSAKLKCRLHL